MNKETFVNMEKLMSSLGLGNIIKEPVRVNGGLLHKMYHVTTTDGEYAIKVLNPEIMKRPDALSNMINSERIAKAFENRIPLVRAMEFEGKQIQCLETGYFLVFPWVQGSSVFAKDITAKHCKIIGEILGKIHQSRLQVEGVLQEERSFGMFEWEYYKQCLNSMKYEKQWAIEYEKAICDIINWNRKACDAGGYLSSVQVISHRDLDPKNVMWNENKAYVIDWEAAGYINPFQELLEVVNYWCDDGTGEIEQDKFDPFMAEYCKYMKLEGVNWEAVFNGSYTGMLGWLEYNVKRALGIEISDESEIALGEEQVIGTLKELYSYQEKAKKIKVWIGG